jgi:hypothetical protein
VANATEVTGAVLSAAAQFDDGGSVGGEDVGAGKGPAGGVPAGFGVRGGGLVVSLR